MGLYIKARRQKGNSLSEWNEKSNQTLGHDRNTGGTVPASTLTLGEEKRSQNPFRILYYKPMVRAFAGLGLESMISTNNLKPEM